MRFRSLVSLAVALLVAACGSKSTPTTPSAPVNPVFFMSISPAAETPPITGPEAGGTGTSKITFNLTRDSAGVITAATATFEITLSGFPANTPMNIAHIHVGNAGVPGGIVVNTGLVPGEVVLANGSGSFTKSNVPMTNELTQTILNNPTGYYFNVHSTLNPGGVARGQLNRIQ